ncbi:SMC-Scp complex subunit ScpB [Pseudomonas fluorescens]|nr:SMC-Scp complex subunit ScpB [Pseudomonas fluorescens]
MNLTEPRELAPLLEAFLLASGKPQSLERLFELFEEAERPEPPVFKKALEILRKSCDGRAFELREVASGYRLQIREKFSPWVGRLWEERPQRYSRAMLETMALIAYRQPITRGEIEDVRGVAVNSHIVKTLLEREWIRIVGYRDVPGKPAMFATTKVFLDHFNLKNLDDLPPLAELREMEPDPVLDFDDAPVPASLQELADATAEPEEPKDETSFHTLLLELDDMEQGIKTDFDDLLRDGAAEPETQVNVETVPEVDIEVESEPGPEVDIEVEPEPEEDILGVAEAREKLLAAVAALEQPPLSDEEDEARALAEAIEAERVSSKTDAASKCGSWLACDTGDSVFVFHRGDAIAGEPAPTENPLPGRIQMSSTKDPCISICKFSDDICVGCGRSKREIRAWKKLDKVDKRTVLAEAELRLLALGATGRRKSK